MDKLENQLRADAASINVTVSPQLEDRIRASLEAVTPEQPEEKSLLQKPLSTWWASSLTGIAAVAVVMVVFNLNQPEPPAVPDRSFSLPLLTPNLKINQAVMTAPLQKELEDLEADLRKAEEAVRRDIGFVEITD